MKISIVIFILCLFSFSSVHAAFIIRHQPAFVAAKVATITPAEEPAPALSRHSGLRSRIMNSTVVHTLSSIASHVSHSGSSDGGINKSGWPGTLSAVFAGLTLGCIALLIAGAGVVAAIVLLPPLSVLALVFGFIGISRRFTNHGYAIFGLVVGGIIISSIVLLIFALAGVFG